MATLNDYINENGIDRKNHYLCALNRRRDDVLTYALQSEMIDTRFHTVEILDMGMFLDYTATSSYETDIAHHTSRLSLDNQRLEVFLVEKGRLNLDLTLYPPWGLSPDIDLFGFIPDGKFKVDTSTESMERVIAFMNTLTRKALIWSHTGEETTLRDALTEHENSGNKVVYTLYHPETRKVEGQFFATDIGKRDRGGSMIREKLNVGTDLGLYIERPPRAYPLAVIEGYHAETRPGSFVVTAPEDFRKKWPTLTSRFFGKTDSIFAPVSWEAGPARAIETRQEVEDLLKIHTLTG